MLDVVSFLAFAINLLKPAPESLMLQLKKEKKITPL